MVILKSQDYLKVLQATANKARARIYQEARRSLGPFARAVLKDEQTRERIVLAPHQFEWFAHEARCRADQKFCGILAPPDSGKSQIYSVGYPLFKMGCSKASIIAVCCSDAKLAKKRVKPAKDYVQFDGDYHAVFPEVKPDHPDKWTEQAFTIDRWKGIKDPTYEGCGITKPPQGARISDLIGDDVTTYDNTIAEPRMRDKVIDFWYNGFDTRCGPRSWQLYIGGVIHIRDLSMALVKDHRFWFIRQSVSRDFTHLVQEDLRTGETKTLPLWERAWTPEFLKAKHASNPRSFERAYRHVGYSDEERTFSNPAIKGAIRVGLIEIPSSAPRMTGVDLSGKNRRGNVIFTIALVGGKRRVAEVQVGAWSSDETGRRILATKERWKPDVFMVENNGYQQALIDWIRVVSREPINIKPFTTGKQKADEVLGIPGLAAEFENGMWEIPFEEEHPVSVGCKCGKCLFLAELEDHPFGWNDTVMAAWFARQAALRYAGSRDAEFVPGSPIGREGYRQKTRQGQSRLASFRRSKRV